MLQKRLCDPSYPPFSGKILLGGNRTKYYGDHLRTKGQYQGHLIKNDRDFDVIGTLVFQNVDADGVFPYIFEVVHIAFPPILEKLRVPGLTFDHIDFSMAITAQGQTTCGTNPPIVGIVPPEGNALPRGKI